MPDLLDILRTGQPNPTKAPTAQPSSAPRAILPTTSNSNKTNLMDYLETPGSSALGALGRRGLGVVTAIGRAVQPFMAPQQVLFGGIGAIEDLATGKGAEAAAQTFSRALNVAQDYATYGLTARKNILGIGNGVDDRPTALTGFELLKKAGVSDKIAKPIGVAADFFLDVPLLGKVGKLAKLDRLLGISSDIDHLAAVNMSRSFVRPGGSALNPADWDKVGLTKFAVRVAAAPFSTAPVRDIWVGLPAGAREQFGQAIAGAVEASRTVPIVNGRQLTAAAGLGKTVGQLVVSRFGQIRGLPTLDGAAIRELRATGKLTGTGIARKVEGDIYSTLAESQKLTYMNMDAMTAYDKLVKPLHPDAVKQFDDIAYRLLDWDSVAKYAQAKLDLKTFEQTIGRPGFADEAMQSLWKASAVDTYQGLLRYKAGTYGLEQIAGNYKGLRQFERDAFGQPKTENPVAALAGARLAGYRQVGIPYEIPTDLHFRRTFNLTVRPQDTIAKIKAAALPARIFGVDDTKLASAMDSWLQTRTAASPALTATAQQMAADFKAFYVNPGQSEPQAMAAFFASRGLPATSTADFLNHIGGKWHQNGVTYRPNYTDVVHTLERQSVENVPSLGQAPALANSNRPLVSRVDLPDHYLESMDQIKNIREILDQNRRIGTKQWAGRNIVQGVYDFLNAEGGIMTSLEHSRLPYGGAGFQNWRAVDSGLAQRLKAMDDPTVSIAKDTPFTNDMYIPAAYHDLLTTFSTVDDMGTRSALLDFVNQSFKAHKVANPAAIARDIATNFRLADDMGVNPIQLTTGLQQAFKLRNMAVKGDGAFDKTASIMVNGTKVTWEEILDHGGFVHGNFVINEIGSSHAAMRAALANRQGNVVQRVAAAFIDHSDRVKAIRESAAASGSVGAKVQNAGVVAGSAVVDAMTGLGGPITKKLMDVKGETDTAFKMAVYLQKRGQGLSPEKAGQYADEMFFNYQNQPLIVDFLRKNGISPFAAFQFMASGRFIRTMYENPYAVARWYRTPKSLAAGDNEAEGGMANTSADNQRRDLWIPLPDPRTGKMVRNSDGNLMLLNASTAMPESAFFNFFGTDPISNWTPPILTVVNNLIDGTGFQGTPIYAGGANLQDTWGSGNQGHLDAARGLVKSIHQFGASPWAPGSSMADKLAKSITDALVPAKDVDSPMAQGFLKYFQDGPFAAPISSPPITPNPIGKVGSEDLIYSAARPLGFSTSQVTTTPDQPGTSRNNYLGLKAQISQITYTIKTAIKNGGGSQRVVDDVMARYLPELMSLSEQANQMRDYEDKFAKPYKAQAK